MGIDFHGLRFLQYAAGKAQFGATATLGRQNINVSDSVLRTVLRRSEKKHYGRFCEELLIDNFGSTSVTSFDASDYEHASIVHDFNKPLYHAHLYDTVIDFGTLEHIFNLAVALANIATICKPGGQIIHALPANNYNGHGFWQFSPELFFSLYSASNGFADTEVFVAELDDQRTWWKANVPENGVRVEFTSTSCSYVLVTTRKCLIETTQNVQQSDYLVNWQHDRPFKELQQPLSMRLRSHKALKRIPLAWRLADIMFPLPNPSTDAWMHRLSGKNRHFRKISITALLKSARSAGSSVT